MRVTIADESRETRSRPHPRPSHGKTSARSKEVSWSGSCHDAGGSRALGCQSRKSERKRSQRMYLEHAHKRAIGCEASTGLPWNPCGRPCPGGHQALGWALTPLERSDLEKNKQKQNLMVAEQHLTRSSCNLMTTRPLQLTGC